MYKTKGAILKYLDNGTNIVRAKISINFQSELIIIAVMITIVTTAILFVIIKTIIVITHMIITITATVVMITLLKK